MALSDLEMINKVAKLLKYDDGQLKELYCSLEKDLLSQSDFSKLGQLYLSQNNLTLSIQ